MHKGTLFCFLSFFEKIKKMNCDIHLAKTKTHTYVWKKVCKKCSLLNSLHIMLIFDTSSWVFLLSCRLDCLKSHQHMHPLPSMHIKSQTLPRNMPCPTSRLLLSVVMQHFAVWLDAMWRLSRLEPSSKMSPCHFHHFLS